MRRMPDTLVIILLIAIVFCLLTWLIPAGSFDRMEQDGRMAVIPGTYHAVESAPQGLPALLMAPIKGFVQAALVIAFVFIVGGAFAMITNTGAINAGLYRLITLSANRPRMRIWMVPLLTAVFSLAGATFGMSEEILVFILITIPLARALGFDALIGTAIPLIGTGVGFAGAITNPFTIGIAQGLAELPLFSGIGYRLIVWLVLTTIATIALTVYAIRIARNPALSRVKHLMTEATAELQPIEMTKRHVAVLLVFGVGMITLIAGVILAGWYINEIAGLFLGIGILSAIVFKTPVSNAVKAFQHGAGEMLTAALVIGSARGLLVIAEEGRIIDTMLQGIAGAASATPRVVSGELMFAFQCVLNFFIPSGSGQAALTMPIMSPLSDLLGISRQTAVLAFQLGDGLSNIIIPTSGVTMGALSIAGIQYKIWLKWVWRIFLVLFMAAILLMLPPLLVLNW